MGNVDKIVSVGRLLQESEPVLNDFKSKKINQAVMDEKLGNILRKIRRTLL